MTGPVFRRLLTPIVQVRDNESVTAVMMFAYSFLAMTAYNIIKPITRSKFIDGLGADNLPYVLLVAGVLIGVIMQGYSRIAGLLPRKWVIPATQGAMATLMVTFWVLFHTQADWVPIAFYLVGLIFGILMISQFWTLANDIYDPRQAKRLFGFIGGGASLGGILGSAILTLAAKRVGTVNLLLVSAAALTICLVLVSLIVARERPAGPGIAQAGAEERGVGGKEALRLLRESPHLQTISLVIAFAAIGAAIIEQQLNMAAQAFKGQNATDSITAFLGQVQLYTSTIGFVIQVWLTSRIHRLLGIGFALMVLPVSLGATGVVILLNAALWAPGIARVLDTSLRYTVDKTTREVLFLPLPTDLKYQAKPFVDVTVDRFSKAVGALLVLVLIKPWGLHLTWQQLSYASLTVTALWIGMAVRARRGYMAAFRRSIEHQVMEPGEVRLTVADLSTIETLVEELASPDTRRVVYAIDLLESLDKRNLITPLLLHHESPEVRMRTLSAIAGARPDVVGRWAPPIERLLKDEDAGVRAAAVKALAAARREQAVEIMRPYLADPEPRVVATAAMALADSQVERDVADAEEALKALSADTRQAAAISRIEAARAIAQIKNRRLHRLLVPLIYDGEVEVAKAAILSAQSLGSGEALLVPPLVSLLRNRRLKPLARHVLVGYGEEILDVLAYFLADRDEDIWIRRHIPGTLALIPGQKSVDLLIGAMNDPDGFLRYKAVAALEKIHREHPALVFSREPIDALAVREALRYFNYLGLRRNLSLAEGGSTGTLLDRALGEKLERTVDRIYRLLGLVYPWKDVAAARWAIEHGDQRSRASAVEYLDNVLSSMLRKRIMPVLEEMPLDEKVRRGNVFLRTRPRGTEDTLAQLIHDDDQVVAAAAIHFVEEHRLWQLAGDLEHALEHRDLKDWYVFEAASWALAAHRLPSDKRRTLWMEPLPAVELANRLRRLSLFDFVSIDELFRIGSAGRQVRHERGRVLYEQGNPPEGLQFLLDGTVAQTDGAGGPHVIQAPAALAFEEVLEGSPAKTTVRAEDVAICLVLSSNEFLTLLSENSVLAQGLFKMLLERPEAGEWRGLMAALDAAEVSRLAADGLTPIEKVLVFQEVPVFARATAEQLIDLAAIARQVSLAAGVSLCGESDRAAIYTIMAGEVAVERPGGQPLNAGAGDTIGVVETLGGDPAGSRAQVSRAGMALRIDRDELFELLGDHIDLLQGIFSGLLKARMTEPAAAS